MHPIVYLDNISEYGKFLQLYIDNDPILVFGSKNRKHWKLLEELLQERKIPFERVLLGPDVGPKMKGQEYELVGAGWVMMGDNGCELDGQSDSYKVSANEEHRQKMILLCPDFLILIKEHPPLPESERPKFLSKPSNYDDIPF